MILNEKYASPDGVNGSQVDIVSSPVDMGGQQIAFLGSPPSAPDLMTREVWVATAGKKWSLFGKGARDEKFDKVGDGLEAFHRAKERLKEKGVEHSALHREYDALAFALSGPGGQAAAQTLDIVNAMRRETLDRVAGELWAAFGDTQKTFHEARKSFADWQKGNPSRGKVAQERLQDQFEAGDKVLADGNVGFVNPFPAPDAAKMTPMRRNPLRGNSSPPRYTSVDSVIGNTPQQRKVPGQQASASAPTQTGAVPNVQQPSNRLKRPGLKMS